MYAVIFIQLFNMKWVFILALCSILFGVHVLTAVTLARTRLLAKNRFYRMALFLVISHACFVIEYIWMVVIINTNELSVDGGHQNHCLILVHLGPAAVLCSLLMNFYMCLHRLNATFTTPKRFLKVLTSDIAIGLGVIIVHVYVLLRCVLELIDERVPLPCEPLYNIQKNFLLFVDVPSAILVALIACCYIVVMWRLRTSRQLVNEIESLSQQQNQHRRNASLRMRYNMITLSCIIVVTACAVLPRTLYGLYVFFINSMNGEIVQATNNFLLLNPLVDPLIYLFRIKEVRCQCVCRSCFQSNRTTTTTQEATASTDAGMSNNLEQQQTA